MHPDSKRVKQFEKKEEAKENPQWIEPMEVIRQEKPNETCDTKSLNLDCKYRWRWSKRHRSPEVILTDSFRRGEHCSWAHIFCIIHHFSILKMVILPI